MRSAAIFALLSLSSAVSGFVVAPPPAGTKSGSELSAVNRRQFAQVAGAAAVTFVGANPASAIVSNNYVPKFDDLSQIYLLVSTQTLTL